jgi:hypothetical protein
MVPVICTVKWSTLQTDEMTSTYTFDLRERENCTQCFIQISTSLLVQLTGQDSVAQRNTNQTVKEK